MPTIGKPGCRSAAYLHDVLKHPRLSVYLNLSGGGGGFVDPSQVRAVSDILSAETLILFRDGGEAFVATDEAAQFRAACIQAGVGFGYVNGAGQ